MQWFLRQWMVSLLIIAMFCYIDSRYYLQSGSGASPVLPSVTDSTPEPWSKPDLRLQANVAENRLESVSEGVVHRTGIPRIE